MRAIRIALLVLGLLAAPVTTALADSHFYKLYVDGLACPFCASPPEARRPVLARSGIIQL